MGNNWINDLEVYFETKTEEEIKAEWDKVQIFEGVGPTLNEFLDPCIGCPNNKHNKLNVCHCTLPYLNRTTC
jgi:hypothetical protein